MDQTEQTWLYEDGLRDYLVEAVQELPTLPEEPFIGAFAGNEEAVDWAVTWLPEGAKVLLKVM